MRCCAAVAAVGKRLLLRDRLTIMNKHRSHQIDNLAQQFLWSALPVTWVPNKQENDYAKDYLVEIGEENGDLTGSSFYVQLKGKERVDRTADGSQIKYPLESKYATYYFDKVKDLPVFLVLVDVSRKRGWWLFLQPALEADQAWRDQKSITVRMPAINDMTDTTRLSGAVEEAKKWMRLHHPESIHESVVAHKERITAIDPRFDVKVSLVNEQPMFTLLPKQEIPLSITFTGDREEMGRKVSDLIDKGVQVGFQPGEVRVTGSKLFEQIERVGCEIQASVNLAGTLTLVCLDAKERELARLSDVPGQFSGGRKELWFEGELVNSPLSLRLGPIAPDAGGSVQLKLNFHRWDGQRLRQLAYFARLKQFFEILPDSSSTSVECQQDGNTVFSVRTPLQTQPFAAPLARYLDTLSKARKVAERFHANPAWEVKAFDRDTQETADQLYAVFFGNGWSQPMPNVELTAECIRESFNFDIAKQANKPELVTLVGTDCEYAFFGEKIQVGKLVQQYTDMIVRVKREQPPRAGRRRKGRKKPKGATRPSRKSTVGIVLVGSEATVMNVHTEEPTSSEREA